MNQPESKEYVNGLIKKGETAGRLSKGESGRMAKSLEGLGGDNQAKLARMIKRKGGKNEDSSGQ